MIKILQRRGQDVEKKFRRSLFLFRRDLRLEDNMGLIFALTSSESVIPAFIFTPEQIEHNSFRSDHCLKFMLESLHDLDKQLKNKGGRLFFFRGKPEEVVAKCRQELSIEALIVNRDYTPYSRARDAKLEQACKISHIPFYSFDDALLHPPEETLKGDGKPYVVFTPYFRRASMRKVPPPAVNHGTHYFCESISFASGREVFPRVSIRNGLVGGRSEALTILKKMQDFDEYESLRDFPAEDYSTHLSRTRSQGGGG